MVVVSYMVNGSLLHGSSFQLLINTIIWPYIHSCFGLNLPHLIPFCNTVNYRLTYFEFSTKL